MIETTGSNMNPKLEATIDQHFRQMSVQDEILHRLFDSETFIKIADFADRKDLRVRASLLAVDFREFPSHTAVAQMDDDEFDLALSLAARVMSVIDDVIIWAMGNKDEDEFMDWLMLRRYALGEYVKDACRWFAVYGGKSRKQPIYKGTIH